MTIERVETHWPELFGRLRLPETWRGLLEESEFRVEEFEDEGTRVIRAELPGIDPDKDVEITVEGEYLRIRAERRQETKAEEKGRYRSEFRYGSFSRTLALPAGAVADDVKATYHDGVLEVRVPVSPEKAEARKIPVARG
jgi:HSP20 family protein